MKYFTITLRPTSLWAACLAMLFQFIIPVTVHAQDDLKGEYTFDLGITYAVSSGKENKMKNNENFTMWFTKGDYAGMEVNKQEGFFMIYDLADGKMITLMNEQKTAMVMNMKKMMEQAAQSMDSMKRDNDVEITKTGKSDNILGYHCDQYNVKAKDAESMIWITNELGEPSTGFSKSFAIMMAGNRKGKAGGPSTRMPLGVMLRMESTTKKGDKSTMEATEIHKDGKTISTSGFQVMKMPGQG